MTWRHDVVTVRDEDGTEWALRYRRCPEQREPIMMDFDVAGGGSGLWMLGGLLVMIGAVVLVVWAVTRSSRAGAAANQDASRSTPSDLLRDRFARGEITEQEFEQAKKVLGPDR